MAHGPLWNLEDPIIGSSLEQDVYKYMMLYFIWRFYPNLWVKFCFTNRTKSVRLADFIDLEQLKEEYEHARSLRISDEQLQHIRSWGLFPEPFLKALPKIGLPELAVKKTNDGQLLIEAEGIWLDTTLVEMPVLSIVSELYTRSKIGSNLSGQGKAFGEGNKRLSSKIDFLRKNPLPLSQFGLRRRASGEWERHVTWRLVDEVPKCVIGVSNVQIAREVGREAKGTNAHELQMAVYALNRHISDEAVRRGQYEVLDKWEQCFGSQLLIMLTDTFGSNQFVDGLTEKHAVYWKGFRQDSGDPYVFGNNIVIPFYERYGVDPRGMLCLFTDGLDFQKMGEIYNHFNGRLAVGFGIGTNLTNDLGFFNPLSIVMKLALAAGRPAVKLSDNIAKATGHCEEIEKAKSIFGYTVSFNEECRY